MCVLTVRMRRLAQLLLFQFLILLLLGCQAPTPATGGLPTLAVRAAVDEIGVLTDGGASGLPPTWTPAPPTLTATATATVERGQVPPTATPLPIPSHTPVPPTLTPTVTPTSPPEQAAGARSTEPEGPLRPWRTYAPEEVIPIGAFPRPAGDNGWGMHWIPTNSQEPGVVDRFVAEAVRMNIKWVVFLNDGTDLERNEYLVQRLVGAGIMPVMRLYRAGVLPYDGDIGRLVRHYRPRGVYYYQLYNEPNVDMENHQFLANPNQYAARWAAAAREVVAAGGLPGIGALSPGGSYNHYAFLERTIQALQANNDTHLLNHAWLSVHNYHGLRAYSDPDGFFLFRNYDEIVREQLGRSLPMIGTEAGSYSPDPQVERTFIAWQYEYMRSPDREPYFLAHSHWLLANREGGSADPAWEWQALFRNGWVHPVVTEFFYRGGG